MKKILNRVVYLFLLAIFLSACEKPTATQISDYEKLCNIYDDFVHDSRSEDIKLKHLAERIEKEIPKVYVHFTNIALVDRIEKYQTYKQIAESETKKAWNCEVMEKYFAGEFDSKK